ncbi:MAG TPA: carbon monoxide dehydrogenase [Candidatus Binatia bacterium]
MATFDGQIRRVAAYVEEMRTTGRPTREFVSASSPEALKEGLPIRIGSGANPKIILRNETFVELGNPAAGSCAVVLWTDTSALISDGRITLIGADVQEARGASLPFGQILLVAGKDLSAEEHQSVGQTQYVADQIEGYMVRSSARNIWSRVSNEAAAKGFGFETLGRSLMAIYKSSLPKVQAMEVIFVTSSKADVLRLNDIATEVREIGAEIVKERWKAKGYDLDCDLDCRSCHDKDVCDDIRKITAARLRKEKNAAAADRAS